MSPLRITLAVLAICVCSIGARGDDVDDDGPVFGPPLPPADPKALLALYKAYHLPLPPADAPLVHFPGGERSTDGGPIRQTDHLAFVLRPAGGGKAAILLVGTERVDAAEEGVKFEPIDPKDVKAADVEPESSFLAPFEVNAALAFAIQAKARGWDKLAASVAKYCLRDEVGHAHSPFSQPAEVTPKVAVGHLALAHWANQLVLPDSDRAAIAGELAALLAAEPAVDTAATRYLLRSVRAALVPSTAKPGTPEALIDSLVDYGAAGDERPRDPLDELGVLGFEVVPALIRHLGDERLTRSVRPGAGNGWSMHRRVGDLCRNVLREIAGEAREIGWTDLEEPDHEDGKAAAEKWWREAKAMGEEAYVAAHLDHWNRTTLSILAARYPARLAKFYADLLDRRPADQDNGTERVVEALLKSAVPEDEQLKLLLKGADHPNVRYHRAPALRALARMDHGAFVARLIKAIDAIGRTSDGPYWLCPEGDVAGLTGYTADPRAWAALARAARRAEVGLRCQLIARASSTCLETGPAVNARRVEFVAEFLDDTTARDPDTDPVRYDGPYAGPYKAKIEVRDLASYQMMFLLKVEPILDPDAKWTAAQWAELRGQVREKLKAFKP